jgi:CheY-like chemotaxis protein
MKRFAFVIDDNRLVASSLVQMLNLVGYDARAAYGAMMAIQQLRERVPDVILMDLHMQGLNGPDLCRHLRQDIHLRHVPILAISSDNQSELIEDAREAGAIGFLSKPIELETLELALKEIERLTAS